MVPVGPRQDGALAGRAMRSPGKKVVCHVQRHLSHHLVPRRDRARKHAVSRQQACSAELKRWRTCHSCRMQSFVGAHGTLHHGHAMRVLCVCQPLIPRLCAVRSGAYIGRFGSWADICNRAVAGCSLASSAQIFARRSAAGSAMPSKSS